MSAPRAAALALVLALGAAAPARAAAQAAGGDAGGVAARLGWLAGCWAHRAGALLVEEQWSAPRAGLLLGAGRTTRGDRLVGWEQLRIEARGDTLVLVASPSGQATAEFRAAPPTAARAVAFENPAHDFPQRVGYRAVGADSLVARVEGARDGGAARAVDVAFGRVACAAGAAAPPR